MPEIWQNHRPALFSYQLTQDQQASQGYLCLSSDNPPYTWVLFCTLIAFSSPWTKIENGWSDYLPVLSNVDNLDICPPLTRAFF